MSKQNVYDGLEGYTGEYGGGFVWKRKLDKLLDIFRPNAGTTTMPQRMTTRSDTLTSPLRLTTSSDTINVKPNDNQR